MARADFVKREHTCNGHVYGINEYGKLTKDGILCKDMSAKLDVTGRLRVFDRNNAVGFVKEDFGYHSNTTRVQEEIIGQKEVKLPDGDIDKITRAVYRNEKGMYCLDHHSIFKADGVTASEKREWYSEAAPFEILR